MSRTKPVFSFITFTILLSAIFLVAPVPAVYAASITVNSSCSLANAIKAANSNAARGGCPAGSGADTITLTTNITMTAKHPNINSNITIEGGGYTISGDLEYQIFHVGGSGNLTVNNLTMTKGSAHLGGAIGGNGGNVTVTNSAFIDNRAMAGGGFNVHGTSSITNSTFSGNHAEGRGGAIYNGVNATLTLTNVTVSGNIAWDVDGVRNHLGRLILRNSIINDDSDCRRGSETAINTYSIDLDCPRNLGPADGDLNLGALLIGSPAYFPLRAGSIAIDAGHADYCPVTDQAGNPRPVGQACDLGAHELQTVPQPTATATQAATLEATNTPVPTATNTPLPGKLTIDATCSLADAITAANSDTASGGCPAGSGADTITLTANITLSERLPLIASDITIEGSANSVSGGYSRRIFTVRPQGHLTINNLTLRNGREGKGGAIYSYGNLTISNSFFTGNRAEINGAAIFIELGTASITNSTFTNNLADEKPRGIIYNKGALTLIHVTMSKNTSKFTNGVWNDNGTLTLRNSIIDDGSHCTGGSVTVTNTYIRDDAWGKACPRTYGPADGALKLGSVTGSPAYFPLLAGSLAIDAADADYCPATDQAGNYETCWRSL